MPAHKHAELLLQYAQDAQETETPWDRWEWRISPSNKWENSQGSPAFYSGYEYRRKPETININGFAVPKPMYYAPEIGEKFILSHYQKLIHQVLV